MARQTEAKQLLSRSELSERVHSLPRVRFAALPTPLEEAPRLREALGPDAPRILIKRDDLTGLAFGGNKVRHLEFRLGDMRQMGADSLVVTNVAQSNHARLHMALAARFGMTGYMIKIPSPKDTPVTGNLLLNNITGANIIEAPDADPETIDRELKNLIEKLESEGHVVYNVPRHRFSKLAGTCGYLVGTLELLGQLDDLGVEADQIFLASGTSSAGLALAGKLLGENYRVNAISVGGSRETVTDYVLDVANGVVELLDFPARLNADDLNVYDEYVGERYGIPTEKSLEAIHLLGRTEGLILDPVYTSKAMSALIDQVRNGRFQRDDTIVFVHTGGLPINFAYSEEILQSRPE